MAVTLASAWLVAIPSTATAAEAPPQAAPPAVTTPPATALTPAVTPMALTAVRSFMYQLQNLEDEKSLDALVRSPYDMVVIEPTLSVKGQEAFDAAAAVRQLHAGKPGRLVLAYVNACQAESYRTYWHDDWHAPTKTAPGNPPFILLADPDGWSDNFNVAYWDPAWQEVFVSGADSQVRQAMHLGFDGVYLDWIDAYDEPTVVAAAKKAGVDPVAAMVDFLLRIRQVAREHNPNAVVVQQNAFGLIDLDPRLKDAIDGLGVEDTWFGGKPNAQWGTKRAGDIPNHGDDQWSTAGRLAQYRKFLAAGKPVFTIDYCRDPAHARMVYDQARRAGLVPLVTQVSLDHLTTTPPPAP